MQTLLCRTGFRCMLNMLIFLEGKSGKDMFVLFQTYMVHFYISLQAACVLSSFMKFKTSVGFTMVGCLTGATLWHFFHLCQRQMRNWFFSLDLMCSVWLCSRVEKVLWVAKLRQPAWTSSCSSGSWPEPDWPGDVLCQIPSKIPRSALAIPRSLSADLIPYWFTGCQCRKVRLQISHKLKGTFIY